MTFSNKAMVAVLLLCSPGCGRGGAPAATTPTRPSLAPNATRWSGTIEMKSASPGGSCEAEYAANHRQFVDESATADLEADHELVRLTLRTLDGQKCVFSGTAVDGALSLSSGHETCDGDPISRSLLIGISSTCGAIDLAGDGPYWGPGNFTGRMSPTQIDGRWTWRVWDPGGPGSRATSFNLDVEVHLTQQ